MSGNEIPSSAQFGGEVVSPWAELDSDDLIDAYYEATLNGGDVFGVCREISSRIYQLAGYEGDPYVEPLIDGEGQQAHDKDTGEAYKLADYVYYAARHSPAHARAIPGILAFLVEEPGTPKFEAARRTVLARANAGKK